ncbi:MAG: SPASM domain-containing protein [Bacteroidetes bacterium]|nr:SPASM domain-containing protein [Bacteroidota bacterium]
MGNTLREMFRLMPKLSVSRIWNAVKVFSSYYYSKAFSIPAHRGLPVALSIEPTTSCNLRCPECPSGLRSFSRPTGMLDENFFREIIDQVSDHVLYLTFYFQGEPFLNPAFTNMLAYASSKKIFTATSTNAHYLDDATARKVVESGLDKLIISIDGTSQETYEQYRIGGSIEKVLEGSKRVVEWKRKLKSKTPHLIFQFLVLKHNEHETGKVKRIADAIGVDDVVFKTAQVYDYENGNQLVPSNEKYSRYRKNKDGTWKIKNKLLNHCWKMWHSCVITWDGKIVPCCFDKDAAHVMGDLKEKNLSEIWNHDSYRQFRSAILQNRSEIDICKNCTEGTKVLG